MLCLFVLFLCSSCIIGQSEHETVSVLLSVLRFGLSCLFGNNFVLHNAHKTLRRFVVWLVGKSMSVNELYMVQGTWEESCLHISQRPISAAFHCANSSRKVLKTWSLLKNTRTSESVLHVRSLLLLASRSETWIWEFLKR